ncbi:MAG: protein-methionine-sulfoxide reductase heme-binding subunit MsrQ [Anaeromyxobacteraceae bacterium]
MTTPAVRRLQWWGAFALAAAPLAKLGVDLATNHLGANPIEAILNRLGFWTLTLLVASLAATPVNALLGVSWPLRARRMIGLWAFAYATLHLLFYVAIDQGLDVGLLAADVAKRKFMTVGFAAWLLLVPLAVTSTDGWVRRLGFRAWKRLHRLVYAAAVLGVVHFVWRVKADLRLPLTFGAVLAVLLAARFVPEGAGLRRRRAPASRPAGPARTASPAGPPPGGP